MCNCCESKKMLMNFNELCESVNGRILYNFSSVNGFFGVSIDSRSVKDNYLFVPLRGENENGHKYIVDAVKSGVCVFFVDNDYVKSIENKEYLSHVCKEFGCCCICVENNLYALQAAAKFYIKKFPNLVRIGITGSSGKTTTKEIVASILKQKYKVVFSHGNFNSETGLPLSVFNIRSEHDVAVLEMGMNRVGEIEELAKVFNPSIAVITNIGHAHIGILGSLQAIAKEKKEIFSQFSDNCVGFVSEGPFASFLQDIPSGIVNIISKSSIKKIKKVESSGLDGFCIHYGHREIHFPLAGGHNLQNVFIGLAIAEFMGVESEDVKLGLQAITPLFGRSQVVNSYVDYLLDCYNANPDSMLAALDFMSNLQVQNKKIFILGSMLELGVFSDEAHYNICKKAVESDVDLIYLYGDDIVNACSIEDERIKKYKTDEFELLQTNLDENLKYKDFVLVKGSRGVALERVEPILEKERYNDSE